ncbi:thiamine phosphate synthase [Streptomyces calidiresistens]|uniref:Thiamine-phosphate synthase n=1 Tax=Streptomyces calidiresistens TaxID=1485586 RepID=A0A7W3XXD6_9ACTN|nr:thiamine phosphate synthase [Streptomyces calidiresistens]MBB0230990.1 thiamine phosphate synthase [Streptomyces calidiresistens]
MSERAGHRDGTAAEPGGSPRGGIGDARLYLCTDARAGRGDLPDFLDAVLAAGVDIVQLRDKSLEAREELELLEVFADACRRHGRLLAVNDRADVARAAGADVLHLGQGDLPVPFAREIVGPRTVIGRSTHAPAEVDAALADPETGYFCVGPCWPTPTKPGRPAPGLPLVRHAAERVGGGAAGGTSREIPWFAIGGIDADNLDEVLDAGARRVVVVRAITAAEDPGAAAADLAARLRRAAAPGSPAGGRPTAGM